MDIIVMDSFDTCRQVWRVVAMRGNGRVRHDERVWHADLFPWWKV